MANIFRTATLALGLVLPIAAGLASPVRAAGLMDACSSDMALLCKGVSEGRGRISACLVAHSNKLSAACKPELSKVTTSRMFERMIPAGIRNMNDTQYEAGLRKICAAVIKSLCSGVVPGEDRLLACLYAWSNRVGKACRTEAKTVLDHLK
ncbi:MAG: hypothetical protein GY789_24070 [Hyphomicrobiales bacterium]|nr:hypothetical protein [Hyphomicrobiales bacterium]MCP5000622.1 hypothetical protein [Hyphomicrobiales bacterium]